MFSDRYKKLTPYVAGEQPKDRTYIKLNTNENAFAPSPKVAEVLKNFDIEKFKLYPDPNFTNLRKSLAKLYGVKEENIFLGNGSDEVLSFVFFTFFDNKNGKLLFPKYSYSFYPVYCDYYGIEFEKVDLTDDYEIILDDYLNKKSSGTQSCGVIFPNPNAPTSIAINSSEIDEFMSKYPKDKVVVVDEAYIDFADAKKPSIELTKKYKNLLVVRTFSKSFSLAGMRIGFAIGDKDLIEALYNTKDSFNSYPCDVLSQEIAKVAVDDIEYYNKINAEIVSIRDKFVDEISKNGWRVLPSSANFVFVSHPKKSGSEVYNYLKENGVLVRYFDKEGLKDFVRITIGNSQDMEVLTKLLEEL